MDWKDLGYRLLDLWGKTALTRFCSFLIIVGSGLLGISWVDVLAAAFGAVFERPNPNNFAWAAQATGLTLIVLGIATRFLLHYFSAARHEKRVAATLAGRLHVLKAGFEQQGVKRDEGYFNKEIQDCQKAAKDYLLVAPPKFAGSRMLAGIAEPKFDASKKKPYFDSTLEDLAAFIEDLRVHYALERKRSAGRRRFSERRA